MNDGSLPTSPRARYASETDYNGLYRTGYFAHQAGASSFDQASLPNCIHNFCIENDISLVLDVGAGNGMFGSALRDAGVASLDIDVSDRDDIHFIRCDFSRADDTSLTAIKARSTNEKTLITSFDMAEHIDMEHLADFLHNIAQIAQDNIIISISTRPSSRANAYHSTVLPIDTWKYLFSLINFHSSTFEPLHVTRSDQQFRSDNSELLAVSLWQKRNIFGDDPSHQHYLRLSRGQGELPSRSDLKNRVGQVLDIGYREVKRSQIAEQALPRLTYSVNFIQDWSFLRSLLEVWPADLVRVIIRQDLIAKAYSDMIGAHLTRVGVRFCVAQTIIEAVDALTNWGCGRGELFLTATEGLPTVIHGLGSLLTLEARKIGMTTATFQHGATVPSSSAQGAQFFLAMNGSSCDDFVKSKSTDNSCRAITLGSPKQIDSAIAMADPDLLSFRLGGMAKHYRQRVLVGTNLHWLTHDDTQSSVARWFTQAVEGNPDTLFILRPHPDDWQAITGFAADRANVLMLDEIVLMSIDWPMSRVISAVDGVLSTHSTLVLDAIAAKKPVAILPTGITDPDILNIEDQWCMGGAVKLSLAEMDTGALPADWPLAMTPRPEDAAPWSDFMYGLLSLMEIEDDADALAAATRDVQSRFLKSCLELNLDAHPHANRQAVDMAISKYVTV